MVDEEVIESYFYLNKRIAKTRVRMKQRERTYKERNYYPSTFIDGEEMRRKAFRIEPEVVNHVSAQQDAERHITIMKFKLKHFNRFLKEISRESRRYYLFKYKEHAPHINDKLDRLLEEEIAEIEEAAGYHFCNGEAEQKINFDPFEEEGEFEDSFSKMLELLGV